MGCECFDAKVSLVAIYKGFKDAHKFGDTPLEGGLKAIKHTVDDIWSRGREIKSPIDAYFRTKLERRINSRTGKEELFWEGYDRSIRESMRRNVAWLRLNKASAEKIEQAKLEYHDWVEAEKTILDSNGHIPVRFFSAKDGDVTLGMALHQVSGQDGELVLESQLLPIEQMDQMEVLMGLVEKVREPIDFKQELPELIRESLLVNQEVERPIHMIESMSGGVGIGMGDVHLGSGHGEVAVVSDDSVGSVIEEVSGVNKDDRIEEVITEGTEDVENTEKFVVPMVTRMIPVNEVIEDTVSHLRGVIKAEVSESTHLRVSGFAQTAYTAVSRAERFGGQAEILVPAVSETTVMELPRYEEVIVSESDVHLGSGHDIRIEEVITEDARSVASGQAEVKQKAQRTTVFSVVSDRVTAPVIEETFVEQGEERGDMAEMISDVHLGSGHEPEEEVITEGTELAEGTEELESRKRKFSAFNYDSVLSVIKEAFNEKLAKLKSINSVKAKVIWLQRHIANVVADQFIGRESNPNLGWLVHGWAMIQFDEVEKKQKVRRFKLSPVRVWADRVTKVVKRVKSKFRQSVYGTYKHLFAAI